MFLTDFRTQKYTGGIILQVGIFLTVTPACAISLGHNVKMDKITVSKTSLLFLSMYQSVNHSLAYFFCNEG